jgi:hypothetical protein
MPNAGGYEVNQNNTKLQDIITGKQVLAFPQN